MIILVLLVFFLLKIFVPAVSEQTKIKDDFVLSKIEHKFKKLEKTKDEKMPPPDKKAVVLCACNKKFSNPQKVKNTSGFSCAVMAYQYESTSDCPFMCLGMGDCAATCEQRAIEIKNETAVISNFCIGCGKCSEVCPKGLIKMVDKDATEAILCSAPETLLTSCSMLQKSQKIENTERKHFKIWQYWYKMVNGS